MDERAVARFWARVDRRGPDECWPWQGARNVTGHGVGWDGKRTRLAHRIAWFLEHGSWPADCLLHRCDNPPCVNVAHLFEGSRADNMHDMWSKGRGVLAGRIDPQPKGEAHIMARLTEDDVREIRRAYVRGKPRVSRGNALDLAERFGVSKSNIYAIVSGRSWTHI